MVTEEQLRFIKKIAPLAQEEQERGGILASLTIAQAIVESAYGRSELALKANNLFGIKWKPGCGFPAYDKITKEWVKDHYIDVIAPFRKYVSIEESVRDHTDFLHRERYQNLWANTNIEDCCKKIREDGYATSPTYTTTLMDRVNRFNLTQYDQKGLPKVKVFLSPSSQEKNIYASAGRPSEEAICNQIADRVDMYLRQKNIKTMQNDPSGSPSDHTRKSNTFGPDLHVAIHTNAGGGHGCEVFCWEPASLSSKSTRAANIIYNTIAGMTPTRDRGVKKNQEFYEIRHTKAPCVYIEVAFHDNKTDAEWIVANIDPIGKAIAKGVLEALGVR